MTKPATQTTSYRKVYGIYRDSCLYAVHTTQAKAKSALKEYKASHFHEYEWEIRHQVIK